jgi:hypothetical protein
VAGEELERKACPAAQKKNPLNLNKKFLRFAQESFLLIGTIGQHPRLFWQKG